MEGSELALLATVFGVLFAAVYFASLRSQSLERKINK